MLFPTIIADNFFVDPDEIVNFAKTLKFQPSSDGTWPGTRSAHLHTIDKLLFCKVNSKILSIIFPSIPNIQYQCASSFQIIKQNTKNNLKQGWVHFDDPYLFTAIIYLSKHEDVGTTIVEAKNFNSNIINLSSKIRANLGKDVKNLNEKLYENNNQFKDSIVVKSKYNRILIFDSNQYHYVPNFISNDLSEDRLTLVCFFQNIYHENGIRFPIPEMRKNKEI